MVNELIKPITPEKKTDPAEQKKPETNEVGQSNMEKINEDFQELLDIRLAKYKEDIGLKENESDPAKEAAINNLETHNGIVLGYGAELAEEMNLSDEDKTVVLTALMLHDIGKLNNPGDSFGTLKNHHRIGEEYTEEIMQEFVGKKIGEIVITEEMIPRIKQAIARHMNHPFMVMLNKGERYPEPETDIDKIVFDADMMANAGFKNVAFRITGDKFLEEDAATAEKKNISHIEATFDNVLEGVVGSFRIGVKYLPEAVLTEPSKSKTSEIVAQVLQIRDLMKDNDAFQNIQSQFADDEGKLTALSIAMKGGADILKKRINEEIQKAAIKLKIDSKVTKNFLI